MDNSRGSIWRRWDLHIHTPGTKKNDCFVGATIGEKWDRFYEDIAKYVGDGTVPEKAVAAMGITDYLSIDNYQKIRSDNRLPMSISLIIPNVEIRVQPVATKTPINLHFLFDPAIVKRLDTWFFSQLKFTYGYRKFTATRCDLIELGKSFDNSLDDLAAYKKGIELFVPSLDEVQTVFEGNPELRASTLIGISNNSKDGASGVTEHPSYKDNGFSQLWGVRQSFYQSVDFIFSGNDSDRRFFLGESCDPPEKIIKNCGSLKPCLHGSDAHNNATIFEPTGSKYCWIKADMTFNGLRQVLYEPKDRVRIGPIMPEVKASYQVIDSITIQDQNFSPTPILFNDKLTCIIGGKSTGKSILLHNIARTVDPRQADSKVENAANKTYPVKYMDVYWADGTIDNTLSRSNHKIVYIPQTYLNRLSDKHEEKTEIDSIIEDIVLTDPVAISAHSSLEKSIKTLKQDTDKKIYDLITTWSEFSQLKDRAKELGSKTGIEKEIEKLRQQKGLLSQGKDLSDDEVQQYDNAIKALSILEEQSKTVIENQCVISNLTSIVEIVHTDLHVSDEIRNYLIQAERQVKLAADKEWEKQKESLILKLLELERSITASQEKHQATKTTYQSRIESNEALLKLSMQLTQEELRLKKLEEIEIQINNAARTIDSHLSDLSAMFVFIEAEYKKYAEAVDVSNLSDDLEFSVSYPFKTTAFTDRLKTIFDNRTLKTRNDIIEIDNFDYTSFPPDKIKKLLFSCINSELPLARGYTIENALRAILDDWFNISYNVKMDGDKIEEMSPGKKALVLLRLLINLADSKSPILIDQPEDDLDNRSITDDLIKFIKQKKVDRQIIVVTHNANVVLGGDAEEVIVANRDGINSKNETYRFEYRSGPIEETTAIYEKNGTLRPGILNEVGISQHICSILEGGEAAFNLRKSKYRI